MALVAGCRGARRECAFALHLQRPGVGVMPGHRSCDLGPLGAAALQIEGIETETDSRGDDRREEEARQDHRPPAQRRQCAPGHG